jgi:hypothetical protein
MKLKSLKKKESKEAATILQSLTASATEADKSTVLLCERKYLFRFSK